MKGALQRIRRERAMVWDGAMMVRTDKPPSFETYVGGGKPAPEPGSFLDMRLRASVRGLRGISMADALAAMRGK